MGAEAVREVYPLTGFFSPSSVVFFRSSGCHGLDTLSDGSKHEHLRKRKKTLYFSRLKTMLNSGNDSTRIRKAKSRIYFIFPWRDEYLFFLSWFFYQKKQTYAPFIFYFYFLGRDSHPGHVTAL